MSTAAVQLSFTLRTSPNVRTVHLLGSWDNYKSQLPLSVVKDSSSKPGSWKGTFRFQGSHALKLGSRYWYYYIVDGYHVSHDPAKEYVVEKSSGRKLNILDVPSGKSSSVDKTSRPSATNTSSRHSREIVQGRALSPSKIHHPKPSKPYASQQIREADYDKSPISDLEERFAGIRVADYNRHASRNYSSSPSDLSDDSASSGTVFSRSSPGGSSLSSSSDRSCHCERYGVTRSGQRVKLDCGGARCGSGASSSSDCSSEDDDSSEDERRYRARVPEKKSSGRTDNRRHAVVERRR